jgi:FdrA protein
VNDAGPASPPRTIGAATRQAGGNLALISVPGRHVFSDAVDAIEAGCDVMIFSADVPVEQEIALKELAARHGRLVMGPECGTALLGGVGLGLASAAATGPVGIVTASGTGAQQVLCLLDAAGVGVSAVLGVGARDLSTAVAGRSTVAALDALGADPATELILVVAPPPAEQVVATVRARAASLGKPVVLGLLDPEPVDLTAATEEVLLRLGVHPPRWPRWTGRPKPASRSGSLVGLYGGAMLCHEAMIIASAEFGRIGSNVPLRADWRVDPEEPWDGGHLMLHMSAGEGVGGGQFPAGDPASRVEQLGRLASDGRVGALLLDVVLGHGAHADPASVLAPATRRRGSSSSAGSPRTGGSARSCSTSCSGMAPMPIRQASLRRRSPARRHLSSSR